jgi:nucleoid-associated protein YgaU
VCGCSGESALGAVEEALAVAEKHGDRSSELLTALVAEARAMIEQAKSVQAERARAAAEEAAAAAAVEAATKAAAEAERLRLEEEVAAITLRVQSDMILLQQVQAQLGSSVVPPSPHREESMCVMCLDAPMDHIIIPCGHQCVCGACAEALKREAHPACPLCREPIIITTKVYLG